MKTKCKHPLAERETAATYGFCPQCLAAENARFRAALEHCARSPNPIDVPNIVRKVLAETQPRS